MGFLRKIFGAPASIVLGSIQQIPAFMIIRASSQFAELAVDFAKCLQVTPKLTLAALNWLARRIPSLAHDRQSQQQVVSNYLPAPELMHTSSAN